MDTMQHENNSAGTETATHAAKTAETKSAETKSAKAPAKAAVPPVPAPETKMVRFPLAIFKDEKFLGKFPKAIQAKLTKVGITKAGGREWGPEIAVTDKEARNMFEIAQNIYRNVDEDADKNMKTFGYQLRNKIAEVFGYPVEVRVYNRKPKAAPEAANDTAQAAAPVNQPEMQLAASMPPRANLDRANALLANVITILKDNGQPGVADLVNQAKTEIEIEA